MKPKKYIPTLDGWRAVAVIGVILYHGKVGFFSSRSYFYRLSAHGALGVDIFFAISGFLICGLLLKEYAADGDINFRRFYIRRSCRILPPYYVALGAFCALSILGVISLKYSDVPSCLLFYRNYLPLGIDGYGGFYTAHFWTLAVEEHFYLFWPVLLLAVKPKRAGLVAFPLAMLVYTWRVLEGHFHLLPGLLPQANLLSRTDTRIDSLLWGCLAAIYFPTIQRYAEKVKFSQLWIPILTLMVVAQAVRVPGLTLVHAVLFPALLLSTVIQPASWLGRVLEWKILRWVGGLSYSMYLWQELFLPEAGSEAAHGLFRHLQQWPANVVAILVCACLSRYLIELPMSRVGHRLSATSPSLQPVLVTNPGHASRGRIETTAALRPPHQQAPVGSTGHGS